ncbi:MAG: ECF transporter S component [Erysipelotrichaceae bacterium]|nr:ECF transporter S component [Erysipelotrichaceae bacterium]
MQLKRAGQFLAATVFIFLLTVLGKFRLGNLGYLNLSLAAIMVLCRFFEPPYALIVAGLPTALADLVLQYPYYAPYTFIIKGAVGFLTALLSRREKLKSIHCVFLGLLEVIGYLIADFCMFGKAMALLGVRYSLIQFALSVSVVCVYNHIIKKQV